MPKFQFDLPPPEFRPDIAFGPWLIGLVCESILTGVIIFMVIDYGRSYARHDRPHIRYIVFASLLVALWKTAGASATVWHKLIDGWASFNMALTSSPWYARLDGLPMIIEVLLAQTFFALRLNALLKGAYRWFLIPVVLSMLISLAGHLGIVIQMFLLSGSFEELELFKKLEIIGYTGLMSTDFFIAFSFCLFLLRSRTGMKRTDSLVARLVFLGFTTAVVPAICDLITLVTYYTLLMKSVSFIAFAMCSPKLYTVSMMVTLNLRQSLRTDEKFHVSGQPGTSGNSSAGISGGQGLQRSMRHGAVHVSTDRYVVSDNGRGMRKGDLAQDLEMHPTGFGSFSTPAAAQKYAEATSDGTIIAEPYGHPYNERRHEAEAV